MTDIPRSASPDPFNEKDLEGIDVLIEKGENEVPMNGSATLFSKKGLRARFFDLERGPFNKRPSFPRLGRWQTVSNTIFDTNGAWLTNPLLIPDP